MRGGAILFTAVLSYGAVLPLTAALEQPAHGPHPEAAPVRPPAVKGNPAFDPAAPDRLGRVGRLLFRCTRATDSSVSELYASAVDFDEGTQNFFVKRSVRSEDIFYPTHGFFLDGGKAAVFMIHDGKGVKGGDAVHIDQSVNMGMLLLYGTDGGTRAFLEILAEAADAPAGQAMGPYACEPGTSPPLPAARGLERDARVRAVKNPTTTTPSFWYREADITLARCEAGPAGAYRLRLLASTKWPAHLAFVVVERPDGRTGYTAHILESGDRLLVHVHSARHETRSEPFDTTVEQETAVGGLVLTKTERGYDGWVGLAAAASDPAKASFSRDATLADYASLGHAVIPPMKISCK